MTIAVQLCLCKSIFRLLGFSGIINFRLFRHAMKDVLGNFDYEIFPGNMW